MRIYLGEQQEGITPSKSRFFLGHFLHGLRITLGTLNLVRGWYSNDKKNAILLGKILGWEVRFICPLFLLSGNSKICKKFKQSHKTAQMNIQCTHKLNNTSIFLITNSPSTTLPKITTVNVNTDFPIIT